MGSLPMTAAYYTMQSADHGMAFAAPPAKTKAVAYQAIFNTH